ncbi:MAG TPA: DUF6694 family lipoprotein [Alcanivoracaceae bacterium]|nr:DUF6694 family lipoprotein [Alcanivoracaceae bacterium]
MTTARRLHQRIMYLALIIFSLLMVACSQELTLDGSSEANFEASLEKIAATMSKEERDEFSEALFRLMAYEIARLDDEWAKTPDRPISDMPDMYAPFDGMTPAEVVAYADELRAAYLEKQKRSEQLALKEQLDGSSKKAFIASYQAIAGQLTPVERDQFTEALLSLAQDRTGESVVSIEQISRVGIFDGMQREDVLKKAKSLSH